MEKIIKEWRHYLKEEMSRKFTSRVIIINHEGKILLLQNKEDNKLYSNQWVLPGGGSEPGEDPKMCAVRETAEETGLKLLEQDLHMVGSFLKKNKKVYIFTCEKFEGTVNMKDVSLEHQNYDWIEPSDLDNYHIMKGAESLIRKAFAASDVWRTQQLL
jgi:mutator protein MutT|tara:strand:+ start:248 stop:721 length:474 start_codon:yes stop_codon:yes gene_type:complete